MLTVFGSAKLLASIFYLRVTVADHDGSAKRMSVHITKAEFRCDQVHGLSLKL